MRRGHSTQRLRQLELARQSFEKFSDCLMQQSQVSIIVHFNERFHDISVKLANELDIDFRTRATHLQRVQGARRLGNGRHIAVVDQANGQALPAPTHMVTDHLLRYYQTYWLLQWDQYTYYQHGLLPRWLYEGWLMQRYVNYNTTQVSDYVLPFDTAAEQEMSVEARTRQTEQDLYRDGWNKAKRCYVHIKPGFREFADKLDALMTATSKAQIHDALDQLLDRDGISNI